MTFSLARFALVSGKNPTKSVALSLVSRTVLNARLSHAKPFERNWLESMGFTAEPGQVALLPGTDGALKEVLVGHDGPYDIWSLAALPNSLPAGTYHLADRLSLDTASAMALGWALGAYRFTEYLKSARQPASLLLPKGADMALAEATYLVRDLVNRPANDLGTEELAAEGVKLAKEFGAKAHIVRGKELEKGYPAIYAVGKASPRPPLLLDITWGKPTHKKLTLVGKGVVFDTGGLNIKVGNGMFLMKKDMGGAAHVLALARLIMQAKLPVQLRVLVPIAENSVAGNAFRPGDIIQTRAGKTVEIGNTDAEGRLLLCDALTEAAREDPDLIVDFATLTGAAWSAVGPHMGVYFTADEALAKAIEKVAKNISDPLWRFPLWQPYAKSMKGKISDLSNTGGMGTGGAITAALYLDQFIPRGQRWAHFDVRVWNESSRPGRPEGGEAMGLRTMFEVIRARYSRK
jgi:leucyl aminopeptidase